MSLSYSSAIFFPLSNSSFLTWILLHASTIFYLSVSLVINTKLPPTSHHCKVKVKVQVTWSCPALCNPVDYGPPGSSVHGLLQTRILEWAAMPSSRGSFQHRNQTQVSHIAGRFFTV